MRRLALSAIDPVGTDGASSPLHVLCLGAHSDDVEIGAGATILDLLANRPGSSVTWVVAGAQGDRDAEARASAEALCRDAAEVTIHSLGLRDGYLHSLGPDLKEALEAIRSRQRQEPEIIFTHYRHDRHQDHRAMSDLTWNLWRDHLILEYEIPKWDGDLSQPNVFVPVSEAVVEQKLSHLATHFVSQRSKDWFDAETFRGLMRLRGMECRSPSRYAEAFHARKVVLATVG